MLTPIKARELRAYRAHGRNKVAKARELAGETQVQLAQAVGLTQSYISSIENDDYADLPLETTRSIAAHYGLPIEDLFVAKQGAVA